MPLIFLFVLTISHHVLPSLDSRTGNSMLIIMQSTQLKYASGIIDQAEIIYTLFKPQTCALDVKAAQFQCLHRNADSKPFRPTIQAP